MNILVTGAAGFIGMHLAERLLANGYRVTGIDNVNDYYDPLLKEKRLQRLQDYELFTFIKADLADSGRIQGLFEAYEFTHVINLAAQAGVRYSLKNPKAYIDANLVGFANILEGCRHQKVEHLIYASSSSVYGANTKMPFSVQDPVNHPVSLYAATKKANELMAHSYSDLYDIPTTGLRFFTVYGPWGRPDMAYYLFTKNIASGQPIKVFNHGKMRRDFTYIDDVIEGLVRVIGKPPKKNENWDRQQPDPSSSYAPYKLYNIGNNQPVELISFITTIEELVGKKAKMELMPIQPGDVQATYADIQDLHDAVGFRPSTPIQKGLESFVEWYLEYYQ